MVPVILSGGSGTRLWPLSRKGFPKQFLSFLGDETLFQNTVSRLAGISGHVQDVKGVVEQLRSQKRPESEWHRQMYRPWGCYDSIDAEARFQVKRITVKPGATLSLQKHHHRAEHWIVVSDTAEVACDEKKLSFD